MVEGNWSNEKIRWMESFPDMNPNPIVEMDANGAITFFNSATQKTLNNLGFPENPAIFIPDDKVEILRLLKDSAESQVSREIILKDACFSENILFFREFQTVRIYVVNITKQRKAEWELVRKNDEITVLNERLTRLHNELGLILKYNKKCEEVLHHREETFRQAHEFLETVTKGTGVNIAIQDVNLRYLFFNNEYKKEIKRLTGKNLTLGTSMVELFREKPEEQKEAMIEWSKVLHGENINKIQEYGDPGKSHKVYHVIHIPIRDAKENIIGAGELTYDITEQVQIQDKLRETKEYFDNLITYANAPIIVWNPELRVTLFNHAFEHLTGRKAKEVIGKPFSILFPENYLDTVTALIQKTLEGERWESVEIPVLHKNGKVRTVLWNSASIFGNDGKTIVSTIAQGQDITDRKKIEYEYKLRAIGYAKINETLQEEILQRTISDKTLKKTLSLLNASLESTADGIIVVDLKGNITSYNQNFVNMWDIPPRLLESREWKGVVNQIVTQLKNPDEFQSSIKDLQSFPGRESFDMIEFKDGKIFECYSKPQKIEDTLVGRVWSFRDVTDRRQAEEKLLSSIQEKEILLREIQHRVKNNLELISSVLDMTRMRTRDELTNDLLTDIMLKIQTIAQFHSRLYESEQLGKFNITSQFRDQVNLLSNIYFKPGQEINCEINSPDIFLTLDQALPCALIVNEILSNAYKHAFTGRKQGVIEISGSQEDGQNHLTFRDNGIGIPDTVNLDRSTSLGLKLIRTLVQHQLRGSLKINIQGGTEISVEFPFIQGGT